MNTNTFEDQIDRQKRIIAEEKIRLEVLKIQRSLNDELDYQQAIEDECIASMIVTLKAHGFPHAVRDANRQLKHHIDGLTEDTFVVTMHWDKIFEENQKALEYHEECHSIFENHFKAK